MRTTLVAPLALVALAAVLPAQAFAGVASINGVGACPEVSLASAIAAAAPGDTIFVKPGTYVVAAQTISKELTIVSSDANCSAEVPDQVFFEGNNSDRMFTVTDEVTFRGLTLRNNNAPTVDGPLIYVSSGGHARIDDSLLRDGSTGGRGGCVYAFGGHVTVMEDSEIDHCDASAGGGGVAIYYGNFIQEAGSTIRRNSALSSNGGGVLAGVSTLVVIQGDLTANSAVDGGGLYTSNIAIIGGSTFDNNTATGDGAGIHASGGSVDMTDVTLTNNDADGQGGAIYTKAAMDTWDITIRDNAAAAGGGVYVAGGSFDVRSAGVFETNTATGLGGGLAVIYGPSVLLRGDSPNDIVFDGNTAGGRGGGMATNSVDVTIENAKFVRNVSDRQGGGLYATYPSGTFAPLEIVNTRFLSNSATHGGGVFSDGMDIAMSADFTSCDPSTLGKDRFCSEFRYNSATAASGHGGGLRAIGDAEIEVEATSFVGNTGASGGQAVSVKGGGGDVLLRNALVIDHSGASAVQVTDLGRLEVFNSTFSDNAASVDYVSGSGLFHYNLVVGNSGALNATGIVGNCNLMQAGSAGPTGSSNFPLGPLVPPPFDATSTRSDYMPKDPSLAVDACSTGSSEDLDGTSRAQGADYDRGAFERP